MSKQFDNTNSGVLFKNDKKESEKHPDYTGSINTEGTDYWLSAWIKEKDGRKYFSLAVREKDAKAGGKPAPKKQDIEDSDLPF